MPNNPTAKKLTGGIAAIILLAICLCITTFALVWASIAVENHLFQTGTVEVNLNDGRPVIQEHEFLFEPGMTVEKDFFLENESSVPVYYRLYFEHASGGLAEVLRITILDGDKVLYSGTANALTREAVSAAEEPLQVNEKKRLTVMFYFPEDRGNAAQNAELTFTMCAEATQMKNNPNRLF